jgi:hypothetical protein
VPLQLKLAAPRVTGPANRQYKGCASFRSGAAYFAVGMTNSAPLPMLCGQRCITDFWRV